MDFIEHLFGIAPDGGSGWAEVLIVAFAAAVAAALLYNRKRQRKS